MHIVQRPIRQRQRRRMNLPSERMVVNGVGLGELDGMFNIGKMFKRMFTITPSSFKFKNIAGTIGSALTTTATFGMANLAAGVLGSSGLKIVKGPSFVSTHSKAMQNVGYGTMAAAAAAGAYYGGTALLSSVGSTSGGVAAGTLPVGAGTVLAPVAAPVGTGTVLASTAATASGGFLSTAGSILSSIGSGLTTVMKALPVVQGLVGAGGGSQPMQEQPQQGGMTQAEFDAQQRAAYEAGLRQQQIAEQQSQMMPISYGGEQYPSSNMPPSMQSSYGDLRTPYTAITEDGQQVQVDPMTGNIVEPESVVSTDMMIGIGVVSLLAAGIYFMSDSKS